jgi:hypothetical protein
MMEKNRTRRGFLSGVNATLASLGLASRKLKAADTNHASEGEDYYDKLGVTKIINAAGPIPL